VEQAEIASEKGESRELRCVWGGQTFGGKEELREEVMGREPGLEGKEKVRPQLISK